MRSLKVTVSLSAWYQCIRGCPDRYSVFDWGEMPDHLPGKGRALAVTPNRWLRQSSD